MVDVSTQGSESFDEVIQRLNAESVAAFNRGNAEDCGAFYAEDAVLLLPDRPPVIGRDSIIATLREFISDGIAMSPVEPVVVSSGSDMGCCAGLYRFRTRSGSGGDQEICGKFVTVLRRQSDGAWKATVDTFFADAGSINSGESGTP